jgi:ABC-type transport system involved in cytochrome bd biosynthesis fused ATPase/permease subunit
VGSGKSSILAALLGELQPFMGGQIGDDAQDVGGAGPVLHGHAAYCSQVPWVVAGSIRVRQTSFICVDIRDASQNQMWRSF